jgi:hypothetical protein
MGVVVLSGLGAVDPATQPSAPQVVAVPMNDAQSNNNRGNNRRNRNGRDRAGSAILASDPYAALRTRSIFVKGNQALAPEGNSNRPTLVSSSFSGVPEASLVFNGVILVGDDYNAMIEDTGSNKTSLVRAGDSISASLGKITEITFDDLTYVSNNQSKHVSIGQNLLGMVPSQPGYAAAPTTMPAGGPPGAAATAGAPAAAPPAGGGSSPDDILARMKAKRLQELGVK